MGRIKTYLGPALQVTPDDIGRYEGGGWAAEEKRDGAWAECRTDASGCIVSLTSRVGKAFSGDAVNGLQGLQTHLPNSTLAGELETASQAATDRYRALGYRRFHVFDALVIADQDLRLQDYTARRRVVEEIVPSKDPAVVKRMPIVRQQVGGDFQAFFDSVMTDGGEGLVFKRLGSLYMPVNSDGKVDEWVRCKPYRFVDYVVVAHGKSSLGDDNIRSATTTSKPACSSRAASSESARSRTRPRSSRPWGASSSARAARCSSPGRCVTGTWRGSAPTRLPRIARSKPLGRCSGKVSHEQRRRPGRLLGRPTG
jgi:hypothetical protein